MRGRYLAVFGGKIARDNTAKPGRPSSPRLCCELEEHGKVDVAEKQGAWMFRETDILAFVG